MSTRLVILSMALLGPLLWAVTAGAATSEAAKTPASSAQIKQWISELASDEYSVREAASSALVKHGPAVLDALAKVGAVRDPEMLWRSAHIVQQIAISGDIDLLDRSIEVLEQVRKSAPSGSSVILGSSSDALRERFRTHAQEQLIKLGGIISRSHLGGGLGVDLSENFKGSAKHLRYLKVLGSITYIRLTGEKFDDESLKYLEGMSDLVQLHLMETAVTTKGQKAIEKQIDGIKVLRFGPAVIGIAGITHSGRCLVQGVQSGTGADRGGLRPGDMVTKLDDTEITSFEELVGVIAEKKVDQKVKVHVLRAGKASEHLVTLTRRPPSSRQIIQQVPTLPPGFIPRR